ncbi:MAG: TIGR04282 family arsenosugar biosynthesis glycosyltransferase [Anaerolineales bacterium]|nr:TIGR04282 family arsenosugar biosynthesis glycosyltransferase [Anaerolineales bacterium]MCA9929436.1 TIGR04282 family arsenosugar biosynthesis glycosyltransferase [Anaerolineales bacterium]
MRRALLVMAKRPFPGQTKTRLTPFFSVEAAAELYACFLRDVLALVRQVPGVTPFVAYAPVAEETAVYFRELVPDFELIAQVGETLGERLDTVLSGCLASGFDQVAAINSDSPTLPVDYLIDAFARLDEPETDVVLGPCEDGGYYLIGWKRPYPRLVREVKMSTPHVLADTLAIAAADNLRVSLLPPWYDVDELTELKRLRHALLSGKEQALHSAKFFEGRNNDESTYAI